VEGPEGAGVAVVDVEEGEAVQLDAVFAGAAAEVGLDDAELAREGGEDEDGEGEVDTLNETITFYFYTVWGPYSFGDDTVTLYFGE